MKITFFIQVGNGAAENATAQFSCLFTTSQFKLTLMRIEREKAKHTGGMEPMTSLSQGMHSTAVLQPLPGVSQPS